MSIDFKGAILYKCGGKTTKKFFFKQPWWTFPLKRKKQTMYETHVI